MSLTTPDEPGLPRRKLGELVEERLLGQLMAGDLKPGELLASERELMDRFKVGRPAIREALQSLQRQGLVDIRHGERPRVAQPSLDRTLGDLDKTMRHVLLHSEGSLEHLKAARLLFEIQMVRIAARTPTSEGLDRLRAILDQQSSSARGSPQFMALDGRFHQAIAAMTGNPIFSSLAGALFGWLSVFHAEQVRRPGLEELTLAEHQDILAAIEAGDPDRAEARMADHLRRANALYNSP